MANEAGNSIVITDTQSNIRHLAEIIKAIDSSAEGETEIRVFHLNHASPTDVANELSGIFPSSNGTGEQPVPHPVRRRRRGPGGFFQRMMAANPAANAGNSQNSRIKKSRKSSPWPTRARPPSS